jgi:Zn-dependent protease with chaperone function
MNFFEDQKRARQNTTRLVVLFTLAVVGTAIAVHLTFVFFYLYFHRDPALRDAFDLGFWEMLGVVPPILHWLLLGGTAGFIVFLSLARLYVLRQGGGEAVAELFNVKRLVPHSADVKEKMLFNVVEEMSIASGTPMPPVYVIEDEQGINAFAAGYAPTDSVLAFSRGCLEHLSRDELQGVVGHEMSHVFHGDARINVQIAGWLYGILCVSNLGRSMMRVRSSSRSKGRGQIFLMGLALNVIGLVGYFFGRLIQSAISRQREFLADASAVQYTRNPLGIAGALKKILDLPTGSVMNSKAAGEVSHFFFSEALSRSLFSMFQTHPPLEERIRAIAPSVLSELATDPLSKAEAEEARKLRRAEDIARAKKSFDNWNQQVSLTPGLAEPASPLPPAAARARSETASLELEWKDRLSGATALLESIPNDLHQRLVDRDKILSVPLILLLSGSLWYWRRNPAPEGLEDKLRGVGVLDSWDELLRMAESIGSFTQVWRLKLVEIAAPALAENPKVSRLLELSEVLIRADSKVSIFELMLFSVMWHFSVRGDAKKAYRAEIRKIEVLSRERAMVESVVKLCHSAGAGENALDRHGLELRSFASGLDSLARLVPLAKQEFIKGLHGICQSDGRVNDTEEAALRALHLALDCPEGVMGNA